MRSDDAKAGAMWSYLSPEARVAKDHPLRPIRTMTDRALAELDPLFATLYSKIGRPGVPPEQLLRALVLQLLYSIRSERLLMEELDYNLLFRWFVGLNADDPVWHVTVFTKNRTRFIDGLVAQRFFAAVVAQANAAGLLSDEHFTVDGTLIEAWAGQQSFQPKDGSDPSAPGSAGDFKGQRRRNDTHQSTTDPDARLYRKGDSQPAELCYQGHVLSENRNGLVVGGMVSQATGSGERESALALVGPPGQQRRRRITLGCDKAYDTAAFVAALRLRGITPHVCQNTTNRRSAIDRRTTHYPGYAMSQAARRRGERVNGWLKTVGLQRQTHHRGTARVGAIFVLALAVYDLVRMRTLTASAA